MRRLMLLGSTEGQPICMAKLSMSGFVLAVGLLSEPDFVAVVEQKYARELAAGGGIRLVGVL